MVTWMQGEYNPDRRRCGDFRAYKLQVPGVSYSRWSVPQAVANKVGMQDLPWTFESGLPSGTSLHYQLV